MSPTHQSLNGSDTPCLVLDDRLIDELKLITPDSLAKIVLQRIAAVRLGLELLVVDTEAFATLILRLIERQIGILQDFVATIAMLGRKGDTDTASDNNRLPFNVIGRAQDLDQPPRQRLGSAFFRLPSEQIVLGKPAATETGCNVDFTNGRLDAGRNLPEKDVAGVVPICVIHGLEVVEIKLKDGKLVAHAAQPRQALLDLFSKQASVGQIRQRVVKSKTLDLGLRVLPLRNVVDERNQILRLLVAVTDNGPAHGNDTPITGSRGDGELAADKFIKGFERPRVAIFNQSGNFLGKKFVSGLAENLVAGNSHEGFVSTVHKDELPGMRILDDDRHWDALDDDVQE